MVIFSTTMAASISNSGYTNKNVQLAPFDSFVHSRGRSTRAASLALPNNSIVDFLDDNQPPDMQPFNLAPPSASSINIRRHSSHHCQIIDKVSDEQKSLQTQPVLPLVPPSSGHQNHQPHHQYSGALHPSVPTTAITSAPVVPPPVPKRTFYKIIDPPSQPESPQILEIDDNSPKTKRRSSKRSSRKQKSRRQINGTVGTKTAYNSVDQSSDDDLLSIESSVFGEECSNELPVFDSSTPFISSNRSSSDSNKSQTTIDTGYMTSASNDNDRIFFGGSADNYRSRFSSVDTQSSIDSITDTHKGINSPLSSGGLNGNKALVARNGTNSTAASNVSYYSARMIRNEDGMRRPPVVPMRKQTSVPKIPPPASTVSSRTRGIPPVPPMRSQNSLDSGKMLQNGHMLGAFQGNQKNVGQEMHSKPMMKGGTVSGKAPSLTQMHHSKLTQRQDSSISSDSYSMTSSPGYNTKSMEAPLLQHAAKINKSGLRHQDSNDSFGIAGRYRDSGGAVTIRQDSNVSSDSFSQTSSPGYNTKLIEAPLIAHAVKLHTMKQNRIIIEEIDKNTADNNSNNPIIKSASTPASLQTIVRFQNGSNMSLQHKIMNRRKSSNPYVTRGRLQFRLFQILLNAIALLIIAGGLAAYFKAYPTVKFVNKTIITPPVIDDAKEMSLIDKNPAPGVCLPIIVKFCENAPYNYTIFPNYIGHFGQLDAEEELEAYDALVDVKCYELVSLFLCSIFAPKCGSTGLAVAPCKSLCLETTRRCGFFFDVFGLGLPEYLNCNILTDTTDPDICIGLKEVQLARIRAKKPACSGFLCDQKRCIPSDWRCDGHVDCLDQADESECDACGSGEIYCGEKRCMSQMHVCDGIINCPYGQDERNCVRLSERYGDIGKGTLEVYKPDAKQWVPACVNQWEQSTSPAEVCTMLGYSSVNSSRVTMRKSKSIVSTKDDVAMWRMSQKKHRNLLKEFNSCPVNGNYQVVNLTCSNYECGKIRTRRTGPKTRIVGGTVSAPGDWPFIAAILGGPEEIFYCAGVLIADQWVLTASHCVGNHTLRNINDWTIQLGITRRHSHSYYGEKVKIQRVIPHPQYNSEIIHDNDIALFQLATRVPFHEHLLPVCLPPAGMKELKPGTSCTVIGWGKKELKKGSAAYEPTVNEVQVPVLNRELCNDWLVQLNVTEGMICAGYSEGGKDACQGDSGGPLLCRDPNDRERWFVGGIVSWGVKCAHPKLPGVYANVPKYIPWITQQMHRYSNNHNDNKEI